MLAQIGVRFFQIVGFPDEERWSQIQIINPSSMEEMALSGGLSILMSVNGKEASEKGSDWLQNIVELFLKNKDKGRLEWLTDTCNWFSSVCGESDSLLLVLVVPHDGVQKKAVYIGGNGSMKTYISRNGEQGLVWQGGRPVSGWLKNGDVLIGGTELFLSKIWAPLEGEVESMVEEAREALGINEEKSGMVGVIMVVEEPQLETERIVGTELPITKEKNDETVEADEEPEKDDIDIEVKGREPLEGGQETQVVDEISEEQIAVDEDKKETKNEEAIEKESSAVEEDFKLVEQVVDEEVNIDYPETLPEAKKVEDVGVGKSNVLDGNRPSLKMRILGKDRLVDLSLTDDKRTKLRRLSLMLGAIFLVIFVIGVVFGSIKMRKNARVAEFNEFLNPVKYEVSEARNLIGVNSVRSRELVESARKKWKDGEEYKDGEFSAEYAQIGKDIEVAWLEVSGEKQVEGKVLADLTVLRENFDVSNVNAFGGQTVVVDKNIGSVALIDSGYQMKVIGGGDKYKKTRDLYVIKSFVYALLDDGIYTIDLVSGKEEKLVSSEDDIWSGIFQIGLFGKNVYVSGGVDIWKYPALSEGVGKRQRWLPTGVSPDLSGVSDMEIATDIYVLFSNGDVEKYSRGQKVNFALDGMVDKITEAQDLTIDEKREEIYVLEKAKKRVVVFDLKTGEYKNQLVSNDLTDARGVVVGNSDGVIVVVLKNKLIELRL